MTTQFLTALLFSASISAFAAAPQNPSQPDQPSQQQKQEPDLATACPNLVLTQDQQDSVRQLRVQAKTDLKTQMDKIKAAKKDYLAAISAPGATEATAIQKEKVISDEISKAVDLAFADSNKIVFSILQPDQRAEGVTCLENMRKQMHKDWISKKCSATPQASNDDDFETAQ